jgi:hypothetical protein
MSKKAAAHRILQLRKRKFIKPRFRIGPLPRWISLGRTKNRTQFIGVAPRHGREYALNVPEQAPTLLPPTWRLVTTRSSRRSFNVASISGSRFCAA